MSLERFETLAVEASARIKAFGLANVTVGWADGFDHHRSGERFDRVDRPWPHRAAGRGVSPLSSRRAAFWLRSSTARSGPSSTLSDWPTARAARGEAADLGPARAMRPLERGLARALVAATRAFDARIRNNCHRRFILNLPLTRSAQTAFDRGLRGRGWKPMSDCVAGIKGRAFPRLALAGLGLALLSGCSSDVTRFSASPSPLSDNPFSNPFASKTADAAPTPAVTTVAAGARRARSGRDAAPLRSRSRRRSADRPRVGPPPAARRSSSPTARRSIRSRAATACRLRRFSPPTAFPAPLRSRAGRASSCPSITPTADGRGARRRGNPPRTSPTPMRPRPPKAKEKAKEKEKDLAKTDKPPEAREVRVQGRTRSPRPNRPSRRRRKTPGSTRRRPATSNPARRQSEDPADRRASRRRRRRA